MKGEKRKMQFSMNKTEATAIIVAILMMNSFALMAMPVNAQDEHGGNALAPNWDYKAVPAGVTPRWTITSIPFLAFSPNPIGIGQELLVNMWFTTCQLKTDSLQILK